MNPTASTSDLSVAHRWSGLARLAWICAICLLGMGCFPATGEPCRHSLRISIDYSAVAEELPDPMRVELVGEEGKSFVRDNENAPFFGSDGRRTLDDWRERTEVGNIWFWPLEETPPAEIQLRLSDNDTDEVLFEVTFAPDWQEDDDPPPSGECDSVRYAEAEFVIEELL